MMGRSAVFEPGGDDLVPGIPLTPMGGPLILKWVNRAAFAVPTPGTFGDVPRNFLRGPSLWQVDVGLSKHIAPAERVQSQFRAEGFNIFNGAQYASPRADLSNTATFGRIVATVNPGPVGTGTPRQIQFMLKAEF